MGNICNFNGDDKTKTTTPQPPPPELPRAMRTSQRSNRSSGLGIKINQQNHPSHHNYDQTNNKKQMYTSTQKQIPVTHSVQQSHLHAPVELTFSYPNHMDSSVTHINDHNHIVIVRPPSYIENSSQLNKIHNSDNFSQLMASHMKLEKEDTYSPKLDWLRVEQAR